MVGPHSVRVRIWYTSKEPKRRKPKSKTKIIYSPNILNWGSLSLVFFVVFLLSNFTRCLIFHMCVLKYACLCCDSDCSLFFASYSEWQNVEAIKYNKNKMSRDSPHSLSLSLLYQTQHSHTFENVFAFWCIHYTAQHRRCEISTV